MASTNAEHLYLDLGDNLLKEHLCHQEEASNLAFNETIKKRIKSGEVIHHFGFGQSPFPPMMKMVECLKEYAHESDYLDVAGLMDLRTEISNFHQRHDHLDIDPSQILIGPGSKELIFQLFFVINADILICTPSWPTYAPQSRMSGHQPILVHTSPEHHWKIQPQDILNALAGPTRKTYKLLILCNPDNPTGACYTYEELEKLAEVCREHNVLVLSDEIYARLNYTNSHCSMIKVYPEGSILSSGFSKWASVGGWRVGYHLYPRQLQAILNTMKSLASHSYTCVSAPIQHALIKALRDHKSCDEYILHTRRIMKAVGDYCARELTSVGAECAYPEGALYCFPNFEVCRTSLLNRGIKTGQEMCESILQEAAVALMAGGPAFLRPLEELSCRLCFVNFNGAKALKYSYMLTLEQPLPEDFIQNYAESTYQGIQNLKKWAIENQE